MSLDGKIVLITGANTGIGLATAVALAREKAKIYIACRSQQKAEEAIELIVTKTNNQNVHYIKLDLNDLDSVDECSEEFGKRESKLDILINNAGMLATSIKARSKQGFEQTFAVNHLGHFLLSLHMIQYLRKSKGARVISLSSFTHGEGRIDFNTLEYWNLLQKEEGVDLNKEPLWTCTSLIPNPSSLYSQTKLAVLLFSKEFANRYSDIGISSNSMCPGVVATNILDDFGWFIRTFGPYVMRLLSTVGYGTTAERSAETVMLLASDKSDNVTGKYFTYGKEKVPAKVAFDVVGSVRLWNLSAELTQAHKRVKNYDEIVKLAKPRKLSGLAIDVQTIDASYTSSLEFQQVLIFSIVVFLLFITTSLLLHAKFY